MHSHEMFTILKKKKSCWGVFQGWCHEHDHITIRKFAHNILVGGNKRSFPNKFESIEWLGEWMTIRIPVTDNSYCTIVSLSDDLELEIFTTA